LLFGGDDVLKRANHLTRLAKLRTSLKAENLDAALISFLPHVRYLCGYSGSNGLLFVTGKSAWFFTDFRYTEQARQEVRGAKVVVDERNIWKDLPKLKDACLPQIKIGFQSGFVSHQQYNAMRHLLPKALWVGLDSLVEPIAMVKDDDEIALIQRAASIADKGFAKVLECIRPGVRELDVAAELEYIMKKAGSENPAFETIVASGRRSAMPHGVASKKKIANGDFVTLDFGAMVGGYVSDITRTVVVGKATARQKKMYKLVQRSQKAAFNRIRAGATGLAVDRAARKVIERAGHGKNFGHGLGHGIGLQVHESPSLSTSSTDTLAKNMVFTVEPGVYFKGWGGVRIEDDVVITSRGMKILTESERSLIEL
jgi:Xaa-Pro aminopeptidase